MILRYFFLSIIVFAAMGALFGFSMAVKADEIIQEFHRDDTAQNVARDFCFDRGFAQSKSVMETPFAVVDRDGVLYVTGGDKRIECLTPITTTKPAECPTVEPEECPENPHSGYVSVTWEPPIQRTDGTTLQANEISKYTVRLLTDGESGKGKWLGTVNGNAREFVTPVKPGHSYKLLVNACDKNDLCSDTGVSEVVER